MVEMQVIGLTLDEETKVPILMLRSQDAELNLQIIVAPLEGMSISMALHQLGSRRSYTHELALRILDVLDAKLLAVEIYQFKPGVFNADLLLASSNGATTRLDSRPADAVVLALGAKIPILVSKELLTDQGTIELPSTDLALRFKKLASLGGAKSGLGRSSNDILTGDADEPEAEEGIGPDEPGSGVSGRPHQAGRMGRANRLDRAGSPDPEGRAGRVADANGDKKFPTITISVQNIGTLENKGRNKLPGNAKLEPANPEGGNDPRDKPSFIFGTVEERQKWLEKVTAQAQTASGTEEEKRWREILNSLEPVSKYKM